MKQKTNKLAKILAYGGLDHHTYINNICVMYNSNSFLLLLPHTTIKNVDRIKEILKRIPQKRVPYNQTRTLESYMQQWIFMNRFVFPKEHNGWIFFKEDINWFQKMIYKILGYTRKGMQEDE